MSTYCRSCETFHFGADCFPTFTVFDEDGDDWEVRAPDSVTAAERFAEQLDASSLDYSIISGGEYTVTVVSPEGDSTVYSVTGESVPRYSAAAV